MLRKFINNLFVQKHWLIVSFILLAIVLRLYHLGSNPFWLDESIAILGQWGMEKMPSFFRLFDPKFCIQDQSYLNLYKHGFLYYWQLIFGETEFALRLSSVLFSMLSIVVLYKVVRKWFSAKAAYIAILLMSVAPFHIYYAQELRPYAAICFLSLLSVSALLAWLDKGKTKALIVYILSNIVSIYFHAGMILVLGVFVLGMVLKFNVHKELLRKAAIAHVIILVCISPIILNISPGIIFMLNKPITSAYSEFPIWAGERIGLKSLLFTIKNFSIGYNVDFFSVVGVISTFLFGVFLIWGIVRYWRRVSTQMFALLVLVPTTVLFMGSMVKTCYVDRYLFASFPFFIAFVAAGLSCLNNRFLVLALGLFIAINGFALTKYYNNILPGDTLQRIGVVKKQDFREAVKFLSINYCRGDKVFHTGKNSVFPVKFYVTRVSDNKDLINEVDQGRTVFLSKDGGYLLTHDYNLPYPLTFIESVCDRFDVALQRERFWLFRSSFDFKEDGYKDISVVEVLMRAGIFRRQCEEFKDVYLCLFIPN